MPCAQRAPASKGFFATQPAEKAVLKRKDKKRQVLPFLQTQESVRRSQGEESSSTLVLVRIVIKTQAELQIKLTASPHALICGRTAYYNISLQK